MQVLANTLYRDTAPVSAAAPKAGNVSRHTAYYARMGSGRALTARVREWFDRGWSLYAANARAVAPPRD